MNWKEGDVAAVTVRETPTDEWVNISPEAGYRHFMPVLFLQPLPPALTPAAIRVLDAVVDWRRAFPTAASDQPSTVGKNLAVTADAYIATLPPPDPAAELLALARDIAEGGYKVSGALQKRAAAAAVNAMEAAR